MAENDAQIRWIANEGVRVSRIVNTLEAHVFDDPQHATARDGLLALWADPLVTFKARDLSLKGMNHTI